MNWFGVMPAMTTPFDGKLAVDHAFLAQHATWLLNNGCTGLVMLGSPF
jgi:4-hydroxy-tetrahydrodipicolinate synthase